MRLSVELVGAFTANVAGTNWEGVIDLDDEDEVMVS
jgi:hypothetical protein